MDLVQSISSDVFDTTENEVISKLDETMRKVPIDDKDTTETVFSTKQATFQRNSKKYRKKSKADSHRPKLESSTSSTTSIRSRSEVGGMEEELEEKLPPSPHLMVPTSNVPKRVSSFVSVDELKGSHGKKVRSKKKRHGGRIVGRIRASKALVQSDQKTVADAVQLMVDRRYEATLLTNTNGTLSGILTDKDVAFRVVAKGLDPKTTIVSDVMTPNPSCVSPGTSTMTALKTMVSGQFRHLAVMDNGKVAGLLDITKCLYDVISKIEKAYEASSERFTRAVEKLEREIGGVGGATNLFEVMREKLFMPTINTLVNEGTVVPKASFKTTSRRAAEIMLENKCSAVMVYDINENPAGIFTTKDLMRRTIAANRDPSLCLVQDVMTPNPDFVSLDTSIVDALHLMHDGKFLHLPVLGRNGTVIGLTDVLQVTYGVVNQMGSLQQTADEQTTPVWKNFWNSMVYEEDTSTIGNASNISSTVSVTSVDGLPPTKPTSPNQYPDVFVYKMVDANGYTHRFTASAESVELLLQEVIQRVSGATIRDVKYVDDEGDTVVLFTDDDLKDAVVSARASGKRILKLVLPFHQPAEQEPSPPEQEESSIFSKSMHYAMATAAAAALTSAALVFSRKS